MMRIFVAAAALSALAAPAIAQQSVATSRLALSAEVPALCGTGGTHSFPDPVTVNPVKDVTVTLADADGFFAGETLTANLGNIWCNKAASVKVDVVPMTNTTAPVTDAFSFINLFNVEATVGVGNQALTTNGAAVSGTVPTTGGAFELGTRQYSDVVIRVLKDPQNRRPYAGSYSGSVTMTVTSLP